MEPSWADVSYRFWIAWTNAAAFRVVAAGMGLMLALTVVYTLAEVARQVRPNGRTERLAAGLFMAWVVVLEALMALLGVLVLVGARVDLG